MKTLFALLIAIGAGLASLNAYADDSIFDKFPQTSQQNS